MQIGLIGAGNMGSAMVRGWGLLESTDTLAVRRGVTSPGGTTARGLAALEREGVRRAFAAAMDDVLDG
jgi:pyrroline-5-carboxylate reductase